MIEAMLNFEEKRDPNYLNYSLYNTRNIFLLTQYIRDKEIYNFITKMVDPEPNNRPTSREVKEFFYSKI
jgi:serine/threonine protein kinase